MVFMTEAAKILGVDDERAVLQPHEVPELPHSFQIQHPYVDDVVDWSLPEGPILDDAGRLSYRNAVLHPEILAQLTAYKAALLDFIAEHNNAATTFGWQLVLDEVMVNALKHGHKADPRKAVKTRYGRVDNRIVVQVEDEGGGFDVDEAYRYDPTDLENMENSCGRGIFLVRSFMCEALWNDKGNAVLLKKTIVSPTN